MTAADILRTKNPIRLADPETAYQDARETHAYLTAELAATQDPDRIYHLTAERKRLADLAWAIKRAYGL